jgi:lactoylglutathione lyase
MIIEHVALWTQDLEKSRSFYCRYFEGRAGDKYINPRTGFESYFISFDAGARLEIMAVPGKSARESDSEKYSGYSHVAFALESNREVDDITARITDDGFVLASEPRSTGDGYYESCVLDPDNNRVEITARA